MQILEMTLHAFGKFENEVIALEPGLNIIRGDNEAGKSTVHSFIEAMFYGFYKPYAKKKIYEEGYEKYMPWDHSGYSGTLTLEDGLKKVRLERQFTKGKDDLKIYDVITGDEITEVYDYNKVTRLHDMTMAHIGFNKVTYNNTISLTQMQTRTEEELIREIKDNMSNLASSHQSTISVDKVIERIEAKENAIGNNRKKSSVYYKKNQKVIELEKALIEAKKIHRQIAKEKEKENTFLQELEESQKKEVIVRNKITYLTYLDNVALIDKAEVLDKEIKKIEKDAEELALYKDFDRQVVGQLQQDKEIIDKLEREISQFIERKKAMSVDIDQLKSRKGNIEDLDAINRSFEEVDRAVYAYNHEEEDLKIKEQELRIVTSQLDMNEGSRDFKSSKGMVIGLSVLGISALLSGVLYQPIMFGFAAIVFMAIMVVLYMDKQRRFDYQSDRLKVDKLVSQKESLQKKIHENQKRLKDILMNIGSREINELKQKRDELLKEQSLLQAKVKDNQELDGQILMMKHELEGIDKTITSITGRHDALKEDYRQSLSKFHITDSEYIQETYEKYLKHEGYLKDISHLKVRISEMVGTSNIENLKRQSQKTKVVELSEEENHPFLNKALDDVQQTQIALTKEISQVQTRAVELAKSTRTIAEVEEAIVETKAIIDDYNHDLKVAGIMKKAIETIAVEIQNNFAPVLNEELSSVVDQISIGKYSDIKVNPDMALTVFDKSLNRTVKAESLSEGTIDMLYFGLRLGIAKVLSEGKVLPLILDDAFVQYDNKRLASVMKLLAGAKRQVILLTCHDREVQYLESIGGAYNLIDL